MNDKKRSLRMRNLNKTLPANGSLLTRNISNITPLPLIELSNKTIRGNEINNFISTDNSFKNVKFTGSTLIDVTLEDVIFENCMLEDDVRFENCTLEDVIFENCTLNDVTFKDCILTKAKFNDSKFFFVYFNDYYNENDDEDNYLIQLEYAEFTSCIFSNPKFNFANLQDAKFTDCIFFDVDFSSANLENVEFTGCTFNGNDNNFENANLKNVYGLDVYFPYLF